MIKRLCLRLNHFWQAKVKKKKPVKASIFIKEKFLGQTRKRILIKSWDEVKELYNGRISWYWYLTPHKVKDATILTAGWKEIIYV